MRRRLELACGLINRPTILFLDEPTVGLDPRARKQVWAQIKELKKETGMTIVMTSHYMDEVDLLCDRVAIMNHGLIVAIGTSEEKSPI
jgi:ABC-2 type transport system ATP-binding protein